MDNQNPIDRLWRSLLSGPNQLALAHILRTNLTSFLSLTERANLLTLSGSDFSRLEGAGHDLSTVCPLLFGQTYGASAAEKGQSIRQLCRKLQKIGVNEQLGLDKRQLDAVRRRMQDLATSASNLHHARNVNAHEHYAIDDPGFALTLAGSVMRIVEVAEIPEKQESQAERITRIADELVKSCAGIVDFEIEDTTQYDRQNARTHDADDSIELLERILDRLDALETQGPSSSSPVALRNKSGRITASDLGPKYVVGQFRRLADEMIKQINSELYTLPTANEIDSLIRAAIEEIVIRDPRLAGLDEKTRHMLQEIGSGIQELRSSVNSTDLTPALEALLDQKLIPQLSLVDEIKKQLDKLPEGSAPRSSSVGSWPEEDIDDFANDAESETPTTSTPPSITAKQARTQLYLLRNRIRDEMADAGEHIENWENILQGPIIAKMLKKRTLDIKDWKDNSLIAQKYSDHKKIMKKQLKKYGDEMFGIMNQISDWSLPKK